MSRRAACRTHLRPLDVQAWSRLPRILYSRDMAVLTITEAASAGISTLVRRAEAGEGVTLSRHGRVVAEVVPEHEIEALRRDRETLREAALVMARLATDSGARTDLDEAIEQFGLTRAELEAELALDITARQA